MTSLHCRVVTTQSELDDALRVRWAVFGGELRLMVGKAPPSRREVSCFDTLETTVHLVVYAGMEPVATTRLLLPNREVVLVAGGAMGLEMEQKLDLSGLEGEGRMFAECARFCVLERWRHSEALMRLQAGLYEESRRREVTHWLAGVNTDTDLEEDARLVFQVAAQRGWLSPRWRFTAQAGVPTALLGTAYVLEYLSVARASRAVEQLLLVGAIPNIHKAVAFLRRQRSADTAGLASVLRTLTDREDEAAVLLSARTTRVLYPGFFREY